MNVEQAVLVPQQWQDIPGTTNARIFPCIRKPDITSSNVYILQIQDYFVLIDTGASQEVMDTVCDTLSAAIQSRERPLLIIFGHAHYDHIYQGLVDRRFENYGRPVFICHTKGTDLLRTGDTRYTQADLVDLPVPPFIVDVSLFQVAGNDSEHLEHILPGFVKKSDTYTISDTIDLFSEELWFPDGQSLTFWEVPGHSYDSIAIQIGGLLHVGDVPFALNPGVAGIYGWDCYEFARTLQRLVWILEHHEIGIVCSGHGNVFSRDKFRPVLQKLIHSVTNLSDIALFDKGRVDLSMRHAMDLMDEAQRLFPIIAGRIMLLRYHLEELGEYETAQELEQILPAPDIEKTLDGFTAMYRQYQERNLPELQVILKALQTFQKIRSSLSGHNIDHLVNPSFVRRTTRLFSDLLSIIQGVIPTATLIPVNPVQVLHDIILNQNASVSDDDLLQFADDMDFFQRALLSRLSEFQNRRETECIIEAPEYACIMYADSERITDSLNALFDYYSVYKAKQVSARICIIGDSVQIALKPEGKDWNPELPLSRALLRTIQYAGGMITKMPHKGDEEIIIEFQKA